MSKELLTEAQREYLRGDREYDTVNAETQMRSRIRKRVRGGLQDMAFFAEHAKHQDIVQVPYKKKEPNKPLQESQMSPFGKEFSAIIGLLYRLRRDKRVLEHHIENGVEDALRQEGVLAGVYADIRFINKRPAHEIKDTLENQGVSAVTPVGLRLLLERDEITPEEYAEYYKERQEQQGVKRRRMRKADDFDPSESHLWGTTEPPDEFSEADEPDSETDTD